MKRVLVTGGSRGIGAAAVRLFAADGRQVIANYCGSEEQARALAAETGCLLCRADVSDSDGRSALLAFADEALGGVDVLVNNAGVALFGLFDALPEDAVQKLYGVNLTGTVELCRLFLPQMLRRKKRLHRQRVLGLGYDRRLLRGGLLGVQGGRGRPDARARA